MIRLTLTLTAAMRLLLEFNVPDAGTYYLYSTRPGIDRAYMEAAGIVDCASGVGLTLPASATNKVFYVRFDPSTY